MSHSTKTIRFLPVILLIIFTRCKGPETRSMKVIASAYNSVKAQTANDPTITAWGDTLKPGMKAVAISRDLLDSGLYHKMEIMIDGMEGKYIVLDKMDGRWTKKIDIYMGTDISKAKDWGNKEVTIRWTLTQ